MYYCIISILYIISHLTLTSHTSLVQPAYVCCCCLLSIANCQLSIECVINDSDEWYLVLCLMSHTYNIQLFFVICHCHMQCIKKSVIHVHVLSLPTMYHIPHTMYNHVCIHVCTLSISCCLPLPPTMYHLPCTTYHMHIIQYHIPYINTHQGTIYMHAYCLFSVIY